MNAVRFPEGLRIEPLERGHRQRDFDCGVTDVNDWLANKALPNQAKHLSSTKTLIDKAGSIAGYYTLAIGQVDFAESKHDGEVANMSIQTSYPHLTFDADGIARIGGSRYKVLHLAGEHYHYGWTAEEILRQHPDLRPEEVYSALTYFYDHFEEMTARLATTDAASHAPQVSSLTRAELLNRRPVQGA